MDVLAGLTKDEIKFSQARRTGESKVKAYLRKSSCFRGATQYLEFLVGLTKDRDEIFSGKTHRRKQSAGVVPYVKLLSRSNAA